MTRLIVERVGKYALVRPEGSLGTCGFSPKAWQTAVVGRKSAIDAFLEANQNWKRDEVTL